MARRVNSFPPLESRAFRAIENKQREKWRPQQSGTPEEECSELGIFALLAVIRVKKPNAGINSDAKTAHAIYIGFETFDNRDFGEGSHLARRSEYL